MLYALCCSGVLSFFFILLSCSHLCFHPSPVRFFFKSWGVSSVSPPYVYPSTYFLCSDFLSLFLSSLPPLLLLLVLKYSPPGRSKKILSQLLALIQSSSSSPLLFVSDFEENSN
ncbi:hypothetical protein C8R42DRAFT_688578 [Lentinula raphanica]|nr:hypothetical protein C8R42DRAFT_688578 [Lentinula raphanica]